MRLLAPRAAPRVRWLRDEALRKQPPRRARGGLGRGRTGAFDLAAGAGSDRGAKPRHGALALARARPAPGHLVERSFPFPRAFVEQTLGTVLGEPHERAQAYGRECLTWAVARRLPELVGRPRLPAGRGLPRRRPARNQVLRARGSRGGSLRSVRGLSARARPRLGEGPGAPLAGRALALAGGRTWPLPRRGPLRTVPGTLARATRAASGHPRAGIGLRRLLPASGVRRALRDTIAPGERALLSALPGGHHLARARPGHCLGPCWARARSGARDGGGTAGRAAVGVPRPGYRALALRSAIGPFAGPAAR